MIVKLLRSHMGHAAIKTESVVCEQQKARTSLCPGVGLGYTYDEIVDIFGGLGSLQDWTIFIIIILIIYLFPYLFTFYLLYLFIFLFFLEGGGGHFYTL